jgi:hypothetical protein
LKQPLPLVKGRPSLKCVRTKFGDWFRALVKADVLRGGPRTARGTRCIADDGHLCHSLGEKTLCDLFKRFGVSHEREVRYPGDRSFRADWAIGEYLIEYLGLAGNPEYDAKTPKR